MKTLSIKSVMGPMRVPQDANALRRRLRDYARVGRRLFVQRIVIYSAGIALAAFYYDMRTALLIYAAIWMSEAYDLRVYYSILNWRENDIETGRRYLRKIYVGTVISALVISLFCISVAVQQGQTSHFMPLFMLVSAAIFAAVNNHQFLGVMALRLLIYISALLFIPIRDLVISQAPLQSEVWLQFFTVLFVLSFLIECARSFLVGYARSLRHVREIEREHERTKAAYKVKSEFLSTVSHELRTPLTSIKGSLSLVGSGAVGEVPEPVQKLLHVAQRNSVRLAELIDDLLSFQKVEAGRLDFKFDFVDLNVLVEECRARMQPFAEGFGVAVTLSDDAEEHWVWADRNRLDQVIVNVLSNAIKFSHKGGTVRVKITTEGDLTRIAVADQGIGIAADKFDTVFEQFSQLDSTDQRHRGGTGLGMAIAKHIVEAHGGTIDFISKKGVGTTFFVELPARERSGQPQDDPGGQPAAPEIERLKA